MDALISLPVSGIGVEVSPPGGREDVMLAEASRCDTDLALRLVERVARPVAGEVDWSDLSVTDLDALVLHIRRTVFADVIRTTVRCTAPGCRERVDIAFGIGAYLDHHRPRRPAGVEEADRPGWFTLRDHAARFRLPSGADMLAARRSPHPKRELRRRCVVPDDSGRSVLRRVERAMEALAPNLAGNLSGRCPECGVALTAGFDPQAYCLGELRIQALAVYDDVHDLARAYGWSEDQILSLPRARRIRYTELVRADSGEA
jgi:hypothetical protein